MALPVPFQTKVATFTMPVAEQQLAVTGVGFKPKAVILFSAGNTSSAAWQGSGTSAAQLGLAFAAFTENSAAALYESSDDTLGTEVRHGIHQKAFRIESSGDGAFQVSSVFGDATLVSMDNDGFTLEWTSVTGSAYIIGYMAIGGDSLVASVVKWQLPSLVGVIDLPVAGAGFKPDLVLHFMGSVGLWDESGSTWPDGSWNDTQHTVFRVGAMDKDGNQWAASGSRFSSAPTSAWKAFVTSHVIRGRTPSDVSPSMEAAFLSMDNDGFTLRHYYNSSARGWVASLCLGGLKAKVGTITKRTSNGNQAKTGVGFQPKGLILAGTHETTTHDQQGHFELSIGAASSSSARAAVSRVDQHNVNPAVSKKRTETSKVFYGPNTEVSSADLVSFDSDGFTLSWVTDAANADLIGYIALGDIATYPLHRFDMELSGLNNGWTDVTRDVLLEQAVSINYGIPGTGPLDLVASTGTMKFVLDNSEHNSAGLQGFYSPNHRNCRPGFQLGIRVRYTYVIPPGATDGYGKFIGRLRDIVPKPGRYQDQQTVCQAADWVNEAAITKYNLSTQVGKRADEILTSLIALVPRQPDSTQFDVGVSTFPYALDNGPVERSTVLTEIQRLAQSEYGRVYVKGGLNFWGKLRFEKRTARLTPTPVTTFHGTMQDLDGSSNTGKIKNKSKVVAHPRRVDAAATTVLFAKPNQNNPQVPAQGVLRLSGRYVDPSNPNARVGGTDMVTPVATTDYQMFENANGTGADRTANFTVTAVYGANQVDYTITNNSLTLPAYVTKLQARGRGLYDYDPLEAEEENQASIDLIGESVVSLDMPYQSDFETVKAIAKFLIDTWSSASGGGSGSSNVSAGITEAGLKFIPRTVDELTATMSLEPGDALTVTEYMTVLNDVYFIQNIGIKIDGDSTRFNFDLQRAMVQIFWELGTAGKSELGQTTILAPL